MSAPTPTKTRAQKPLHGCGCCGRLFADRWEAETQIFCRQCKRHVLPNSHNTDPWDRTFEAQHGTPCPFADLGEA